MPQYSDWIDRDTQETLSDSSVQAMVDQALADGQEVVYTISWTDAWGQARHTGRTVFVDPRILP